MILIKGPKKTAVIIFTISDIFFAISLSGDLLSPISIKEEGKSSDPSKHKKDDKMNVYSKSFVNIETLGEMPTLQHLLDDELKTTLAVLDELYSDLSVAFRGCYFERQQEGSVRWWRDEIQKEKARRGAMSREQIEELEKHQEHRRHVINIGGYDYWDGSASSDEGERE
jgi:hypothetical protein